MSTMKKATYLIIGGLVAAAVIGALYSGNALYSNSATAVEPTEGKETVVDFSASFQTNDVTIAKGESMTIPVDIYGAKEKAKDLQVYVSEPEEPTSIIQKIKDAKTSEGISVTLDKKQIKLEKEDDTGVAKRDALAMSITVDENATEGMHMLAITLVDQEGSFMTTYFRVNVVA